MTWSEVPAALRTRIREAMDREMVSWRARDAANEHNAGEEYRTQRAEEAAALRAAIEELGGPR